MIRGETENRSKATSMHTRTRSVFATCVGYLAILAAIPAHAAVVGFDLNGAMSGEFATIDLASELGLAPGTPVAITALAYNYAVTTSDPLGLVRTGFRFAYPGAMGESFHVITNSGARPLTIVGVFGQDSLPEVIDPIYIWGGVMILYLESISELPDQSGIFDQADATWGGELTIDVVGPPVPIPGALLLMLSAMAGLFGFRQHARDHASACPSSCQ